MPRPLVCTLVACLLAACSKPDARESKSAAATDATPAAAAPAAPGASTEPAPPPPPPRAKFQIQLRSTPVGAEAAVDGRPAGRTPTTVDIEDDGKEHEFTFLLAGYSLERYRTRPIQSGVIHARMRTIPADAAP